MHDADILTLGLILFVACLVAIVTRRIGLPYAIGLVAAGIALSVAGHGSRITLTPELIFTVLLPPLIFEAALHLGWAQFRREAPLVLSIAVVGTLLSASVVAAGMHWLAGWGWPASMLFGALIAATDPVSVIAMMKEQQAPPRLRFLMEAESLVNDGAAAVIFGLVAAWIGGAEGSPGTIALAFVTTVGGGVLCGLVVAGGLLLVARRSDDHLVELTLTMLAAYGSFLLAEKLHASGVLATLAAGMLVGNWGRGRQITAYGSEAMIRFWDFAAFLANSVVFVLIGSREAAQPLAQFLRPAAIGTALVLAGRVIAVYPITALFQRTALATSRLTQHILFWGGLRGALALALALATPEALPERDALIGVAFAVVAFSIFVQGLTVPRLLRRSGAC
ncbi:cation:proton antiporter [Sphingomonas nostoxanthinifaciens]|uniref:cation:proton antiporter n=1 Tax=Sphingomonas nostoxanthinifaciens TaxID=2872652 RepID=UPI001CC1E3C5|nr:sodium:proton antiporter [Sphingomonas nostoxanthinifaciens]UAK24477.1 sodium:proton antiporter [Sphingomonas nostoxanthinifaciens]